MSGRILRKLRAYQRRAFNYFREYSNSTNGLIADTTRDGAPCSIAVVGFALSCYPTAVENGWMKRSEALKRTLAALRFFHESEQSTARNATGHRGFYYHFLDMASGRRTWNCEISTIDTTLLLYGALIAAEYFEESEVRERAALLVSRADWRWACGDDRRVALAWKPEFGFLKARWSGYNEALLLQILALGSPEYSLTPKYYDTWCETYQWKRIYGIEYLYGGPLFMHQFPGLWLDLGGQRDAFMRDKDCDYFENTRRAITIHREYCRRNPKGFVGYHQDCWGLSASDGPGEFFNTINGTRRRYWSYRARGAPYGPDDGTLSPWAVLTSLPFAPEGTLSALEHIECTYPAMDNRYGLHCAFNPTVGWTAQQYFGLDQGAVVLAIENYGSGLIWDLLRENPIIQRGLERAGFKREPTVKTKQ